MATAFASHATIPAVNNQFFNIIATNPNAFIMPNRVYLVPRSQMFGSSRFSMALREIPPCRTRSSNWCTCPVADQALPGNGRPNRFVSQDRRRRPVKKWTVRCLGTSAAAGGVPLKPLLDQVLLLGTIFGVYIAGVASVPRLPQLFPSREPSSALQDIVTSRKSAKRNPIRKQKPNPQSPESSSGEGCWASLRSKLYQAASMETAEVEEENAVKSPMLSLQAIARTPRLHLLLTALQHLRKEVEAISNDKQNLDLIQWQELCLNVLSLSVPPVCKDWLFQESWPTNQTAESASEEAENSHQMEISVLDDMMSILKESESIPSYIRRSGKAGLYADLIFFLRFGSARVGGCCDERVLKKYTGSVLEDMVVALAEVVATLFLDCTSLATLSPHGEMWQMFLLPSIMSSRSLERFRNEVALYGWWNQNFTSVAAMFEDRFDLWTLRKRLVPSPGKKQEKSFARKSSKMAAEMRSDDLALTCSQVPTRRSTELKALTGWRYYYSLFLELSDVVGPLTGILLSKIGDAVSFLLITFIGRSLGLIYQGIRQSVRWPTNQKNDRSQQSL